MRELICGDCGAVGPPGFKISSNHRCSHWGYRPDSAAELMYRCTMCSGMADSVVRLIHHEIHKHHRVQLIMCPLSSCGRCYFNTSTFDAHIFRLHQGFAEYRKAILEEYGPTPGDRAFWECIYWHVMSIIVFVKERYDSLQQCLKYFSKRRGCWFSHIVQHQSE